MDTTGELVNPATTQTALRSIVGCTPDQFLSQKDAVEMHVIANVLLERFRIEVCVKWNSLRNEPEVRVEKADKLDIVVCDLLCARQ